MAFDVLSFVMGQQAAKGSGGSSDSIKYFSTSLVNTTGTYGSTVSVNFGFVPDVIMFISFDSTIGTNNCFAIGNSDKFVAKVGKGGTQYYGYVYSNKITVQHRSGTITRTDDAEIPIHSATATGFKLGKNFVSGKYYVFAYAF